MQSKFLAVAFAALVPAGLLAAHDFGNDYDHARLVSTTSIEIEAGKVLAISDNAIHWRADLMQLVKSGASKQYFAPNAWLRKVAVAKVPCAMTLGGQPIGEGEWTLFAKVPGDDTSKFVLEWKQGDKTVDLPLAMKGGNDPEDHLLLALTPRGDKTSKDFELKVFYGDLKATLAGSFGAAQTAPAPAKN